MSNMKNSFCSTGIFFNLFHLFPTFLLLTSLTQEKRDYKKMISKGNFTWSPINCALKTLSISFELFLYQSLLMLHAIQKVVMNIWYERSKSTWMKSHDFHDQIPEFKKYYLIWLDEIENHEIRHMYLNVNVIVCG